MMKKEEAKEKEGGENSVKQDGKILILRERKKKEKKMKK